MKSRVGIVVFPGSNCDHDAYYAIKKNLNHEVSFLWHKSTSIEGADVILLPGGFSYGDYLRCGAIAKLSPIMSSVYDFAEKGGIVIGICNGFQVLVEMNMLPGALIKNKSLKFICKDINIKVANTNRIFTNSINKPALNIPIAHGEGNYYAKPEVLEEIITNNQIVFQYCNSNGEVSSEANPNGSLLNIAGICNKNGNVLGMMPHPERACDVALGKTDGISIFNSIFNYLNTR